MCADGSVAVTPFFCERFSNSPELITCLSTEETNPWTMLTVTFLANCSQGSPSAPLGALSVTAE